MLIIAPKIPVLIFCSPRFSRILSIKYSYNGIASSGCAAFVKPGLFPFAASPYKVNCPRCGIYEITDVALTLFQKNDLPDKILPISFWIRQHQTIDKNPVYIELKLLRSLLIPFVAPKPYEQANSLLLWIAENVGKPDGYTNVPVPHLISIVGAIDESNVVYIADYLKEQGYIKHQGFSYSVYEGKRNPPVDHLIAQMTFKGWEKYDELKRSSKNSRLAFMAMTF